MKTFLIVDRSDLVVRGWYSAEQVDNSTVNRSYLLAEPVCAHLELPEGCTPDLVIPQIAEGEVTLVVDVQKVAEKQVREAYERMNSDVLAEMTRVFGTSKPESATAYKETWDMMAADPAFWADKGLKASFEVAGILVGDSLDTETKVLDYATAKIAEIKTYGVWRMQRIEAFKQERDTILAQP